ncbi:hypothetical protein SAMN02745664_1393 [Moraxella cuniculi DSM 21768]|uniref:Uncharacterized protein n=1 Tax=Moraxella cuniculi DSM 21768 TaxID=1122245 RepID=A0A1N7GCZ4_9GAMM|nr:hypothetical protein [Moraxella cuniculi]OOS03009.1 hypothetical protein B0189_09805 [Moraxella cuniculi]SIS09715.1 hypothetical protein SAMN02745664_1303 [Moraxella cuniculi DSM 21768]SIS10449.1 hypothetical protein SAMN02745664_1393 [Moraxella cuniculi DSM 21768]
MTELQGLHAPFLISWLGIWLFAFLGGVASAFIKIADIDKRLIAPFIAKPLIGTICGVGVAIYLNGDNHPPSATLIAWALVGSVFLTPIITGLLVFISDQKRQDEVYQNIKDKYLPFNKEDKK